MVALDAEVDAFVQSLAHGPSPVLICLTAILDVFALMVNCVGAKTLQPRACFDGILGVHTVENRGRGLGARCHRGKRASFFLMHGELWTRVLWVHSLVERM